MEYSGGFGSGAGINLDAPNPTLTDDTVINVPGVAYDLNSEGPFNNISGVMASEDGIPVLDLEGGSLNTTMLQAEPIPWDTSGGVSVDGGQTLTIEPGAVIKSLGDGQSCNGVAANLCVSGTLQAVGTPSQPNCLFFHERHFRSSRSQHREWQHCGARRLGRNICRRRERVRIVRLRRY